MNLLGLTGGGFPTRGGGGPQGPGGPGAFHPPGVNVGGARNLLTPPQLHAPQGPTLTARLPQGLSFPPGTVLRGEVSGKEQGQFLLKFGDQTLKAQAQVPLEVGQKIAVQVQGEKGGQLHLTVLPKTNEQMSKGDLTEALLHDHMPTSEENIQLAHSMVEHSVPVTKQNLTFLKTVLAEVANHQQQQQGPGQTQQASLPNKVGATFFLQSNNIPVTPQNVATLSNFLTNNPQVGSQMMALQTEFRKMAESPTTANAKSMELLAQVPGLLGEVVIEPNQQLSRKSSKRLKDLARDMGVESRLGPGGGPDEEDWNLARELQHIRQQLEQQPDAESHATILGMMKELEENLQAHQLINQQKTAEQFGFFYFQMPLPLNFGDTAEVWIRYQQENDGSRTVDPEDSKLEFLVCTENLGELTFVVDLFGDSAIVDVGTPSEPVRQFVERYLPALKERIEWLGWDVTQIGATFRAFQGRRKVVDRQDFDNMERVSVQA